MPESFPLSEASMVCFSFTPFPSLFACTSSSPPSSAGFFQIFRSFYPFHGCLRKVIRENTSFDTAVADVWCGKSNLLWQPHHHTEQRQPSVLLNTLTWLTWGFFFIIIHCHYCHFFYTRKDKQWLISPSMTQCRQSLHTTWLWWAACD